MRSYTIRQRTELRVRQLERLEMLLQQDIDREQAYIDAILTLAADPDIEPTGLDVDALQGWLYANQDVAIARRNSYAAEFKVVRRVLMQDKQRMMLLHPNCVRDIEAGDAGEVYQWDFVLFMGCKTLSDMVAVYNKVVQARIDPDDAAILQGLRDRYHPDNMHSW